MEYDIRIGAVVQDILGEKGTVVSVGLYADGLRYAIEYDLGAPELRRRTLWWRRREISGIDQGDLVSAVIAWPFALFDIVRPKVGRTEDPWGRGSIRTLCYGRMGKSRRTSKYLAVNTDLGHRVVWRLGDVVRWKDRARGGAG
jgi:hypothetical protein